MFFTHIVGDILVIINAYEKWEHQSIEIFNE